MADAVRSSRNASQSGPNNGNLGTDKLSLGWRRCRGQNLVKEPLQYLVDEEDWICNEMLQKFQQPHCAGV